MKHQIFLLLGFLCFLSLYCENDSKQIYSDGYMTLQKGIYHSKSSDSKLILSSNRKIEESVFKDTLFLNDYSLKYIANEDPIALFTKMDNVTSDDVSGILDKSAFVIVDSIYYKNRYIDSDNAPMTLQQWSDLIEKEDTYFFKYPLSYEVWYALSINGKRYYTDYKLHDLVEYKLYMPAKKQLLLLCSQSTGYDGGYDLGYPDYYVIVVLQKNEDGWKQIYRSQRLDLNNGGADEYGMSDVYPIEVSNKDDNVEINFSNFFRITWNGKSASVDILNEYE